MMLFSKIDRGLPWPLYSTYGISNARVFQRFEDEGRQTIG